MPHELTVSPRRARRLAASRDHPDNVTVIDSQAPVSAYPQSLFPPQFASQAYPQSLFPPQPPVTAFQPLREHLPTPTAPPPFSSSAFPDDASQAQSLREHLPTPTAPPPFSSSLPDDTSQASSAFFKPESG